MIAEHDNIRRKVGGQVFLVEEQREISVFLIKKYALEKITVIGLYIKIISI